MPEGPLASLTNLGVRFEYYYGSVNRKFPNSQELEDQLEKIKIAESKRRIGKKTLTEKLQPSENILRQWEEFTLTDEQFGKNEKLESASYKLLFLTPRSCREAANACWPR